MSKVLIYVEVDIPYCALTYGIAPCQASLTSSPPTGTRKCFNSLGTCQDRANFLDQGLTGSSPYNPTTIRFALDTLYLPPEIEALPFIVSPDDIKITPSIVSLGGDLGQRATVEVKLRDSRHSDTGVGFDKYLADRDYDPFEQGTFWGKWRFRHPSLRGRGLRIIRGILGQDLEDMETRHYVIDSTNGPEADGTFTIIAKDALKLADGDRAVAPTPNNGFVLSDITAVAGSLTLGEAGIGSTYPASGFANIGGREIVSFTRAADVLTITRAQLNTEAQAHTAGDRVQVLYRQVGQDGADIIYDLLVNYAGVDPELIDLTAWDLETDAFLGVAYTINIAEPTAVNDLISQLLLQMGAALWQDDLTQMLRFQVLRMISTEADRYSDDNYLTGSLKVTEQPEKRVSRVLVYFGQINPLKRYDDLDNYRSFIEIADEDSEADYGGQVIKRIFANGIASGGRSSAERLGENYLSRFVVAPRRMNFHLMRNAETDPTLGAGYQLASWMFQDDTGAEADIPIQITRINPRGDRYELEAEEMLFTQGLIGVDSPGDKVIIFDADENNIDLRERHDELYGDPETGDDITVYINSGVIIGSASTALPAFDVGDWPGGITLTLINGGRIQGAGGNGGGQNMPSDGQPGGIAFLTAEAITVNNTNGEIWGGGGGGGVAVGLASTYDGGGGGAGRVPGQGGDGNLGNGNPGTSEAGGTGGGNGGGAGGDPGQNGSAGAGVSGGSSGGAAGAAISGVGNVTFAGSGDIQGPQV